MVVDDAEQIWADIEYFANYGFNRAHAADYALITCQTANSPSGVQSMISPAVPWRVRCSANFLVAVLHSKIEPGGFCAPFKAMYAPCVNCRRAIRRHC